MSKEQEEIKELLEDWKHLQAKLKEAEEQNKELLITFSKWKENRGYKNIYNHKELVNEFLNQKP